MFMQTNSGRLYYPANPGPEQIDIEDIAHALAMQARYCGHLDEFYSVAQHCVIGSHYIKEPLALEFLLHDATEAYMSDLPHPVKVQLPAFSRMEEELWEKAIAPKFGLPRKMSKLVKDVDRLMLAAEYRDLVRVKEVEWSIPDLRLVSHIPTITPLPPKEAKQQFLERFKELT